MNAVSSRSHSVFMLYISGHHENSGQRLQGALNLVDLAGRCGLRAAAMWVHLAGWFRAMVQFDGAYTGGPGWQVGPLLRVAACAEGANGL